MLLTCEILTLVAKVAEHLDKTPALLGVQAVDEVRGTGTGLESILRGEGAQ